MRTSLSDEEWRVLSKFVDYDREEHFGRVICNEPLANAFEWIVAYADSLVPKDNSSPVEEDDFYDEYTPVTVNELIDVALSYNKETQWGDAYLIRGGVFEGMSPDPMLFEKLSILTGKETPYHQFFSCAC